MSAPFRVLIADDELLARDLLREFLAEHPEVEICGEFDNGFDAARSALTSRPDIVLLDIEMPGPDPFEMADRLHRMDEDAKIVFLSAYVRDHYIAAAYGCGACGYFSKADEIDHFINGLRQVARGGGEFVFGPKVKARCRPPKQRPALGGARTGRKNPRPPSRLNTLSARELEVLRLIGRGMSRNEIAASLSRAVKTIDGHQKKMLTKLGLNDRAELMRFAIREGLVEA